MTEENLKERRKAPRYKADGEVVLTLEDGNGDLILGKLADISRIGIFVLIDKTQEDWAYKMCNLYIKTTVDGEELQIKGKSVMVRIAERGVGMYINEIYEDYRRSFVKFMGYVQKPENAV